jgi:hypothetical protein
VWSKAAGRCTKTGSERAKRDRKDLSIKESGKISGVFLWARAFAVIAYAIAAVSRWGMKSCAF